MRKVRRIKNHKAVSEASMDSQRSMKRDREEAINIIDANEQAVESFFSGLTTSHGSFSGDKAGYIIEGGQNEDEDMES